MGVAELIDRNVKCGEEGVHVNHEESVPFPSGSGSKPTLKGGHLPLKFPTGNSHEAFLGHRLGVGEYSETGAGPHRDADEVSHWALPPLAGEASEEAE